jgi:hypothetical protein
MRRVASTCHALLLLLPLATASIVRRIIFGSNCRKYYALTYRPAPGETVPD